MKKLMVKMVCAALITWGMSAFADNARVDVDGRGAGIKLEIVKDPENGTATNALWLQGDLIHQCMTVDLPAGVEWSQASFAFKPDKDGTVELKLLGEWRMDAIKPGTLKPIWVLYDDIEVKNSELKNGSFDGGADGWKINGDAQFVADLGHGKPGAAKAWSSASVTQDLAVKAGLEVTVSFWFRTASNQSALRIFTIGHSFHANWLPNWLKQVEDVTDVMVHEQVGVSMIGGSRVLQHWELPEGDNSAKTALKTGKVDVLTMSPMLSPDEGIKNFTTLGLEHNPNLRITVQEFWLPYDRLDCFGENSYGEQGKLLRNWEDPPIAPDDPDKERKFDTSHFNVPTAEQIEKLHAPYFEKMNAYIAEQNKPFGKQVLYVVPVGQAVIALRKKIIEGKAPGLAKPSELFIDNLGHPANPICALSAYCHFAVIYKHSPVGLPLLSQLLIGDTKEQYPQELNLLLQQLAWDAVTHHPLSGVAGGK